MNYRDNPGMAVSQSANITVSTNTPVKSSEYEKTLSCVYSEIERLFLHVGYLTDHLSVIMPNDLTVEMPGDPQKINKVPLLADMEIIRDKIAVATNKIMFLNENIVI